MTTVNVLKGLGPCQECLHAVITFIARVQIREHNKSANSLGLDEPRKDVWAPPHWPPPGLPSLHSKSV